MKEYIRPSITISRFADENVCTQPSGLNAEAVKNVDVWERENEGSIMKRDYADIVWIP